MNNYTILIYYIYALAVIFGIGYVIYFLDGSNWLFLLMLILLDISPEIKNKKDGE